MASLVASATYLVPPIAATIVTSMCLNQSDEPLSERITSDNFILWSATTITIAAVAIAYFSNLPTIALGFTFLGLLTIYSLSGQTRTIHEELIPIINDISASTQIIEAEAQRFSNTTSTLNDLVVEVESNNNHLQENIDQLRTDIGCLGSTTENLESYLSEIRAELATINDISSNTLEPQVQRLETTHQNTSSSLRNVVLNQEASIVQNRRTQEMLQLLLQHLLPADDFPEPGRLAQVPVRIAIRDGVQVIYPLANPQPLHSGSSSPVSSHAGETIFGDDGSVVSSTAASAEALSLTGSNSEQYIVIQGLPPAYQDVAELGTGRVPSQE